MTKTPSSGPPQVEGLRPLPADVCTEGVSEAHLSYWTRPFRTVPRAPFPRPETAPTRVASRPGVARPNHR